MSEPLLGDVLCLLNTVVFEQAEDKQLVAASPIPTWFADLVPDIRKFKGRFPFIDTFLAEAEEFWARQNPGRIDAGMMIETDENDRIYALDVSAMFLHGRRFLVLVHRADYEAIQGHFQRTRNQALELRAKQKMLEALRRSEEDLRHAKDAAEAATRAKSLFLAQISHEIRTPLNAILGYTALTQMEHDPSGQIGANLKIIRRAGESLLALLNDVLDMSKVEAGRLELEETPYCPAQIVKDCALILDALVREKRLDLAVDVEGCDGLFIVGDPVRFRQIVLNLLNNAIKFTPRGGIRIRVRAELGLTTTFRIEVIDTGIGVAKDQQARIFQPFTQADASTTRRFGGTGLGLSLSRRLAEAMGGEIGFVSREGEGSTFWFTVRGTVAKAPALQPETSASFRVPMSVVTQDEGERTPLRSEGEEATLHKPQVLVTDDNPINRLLAVRMLERLGAQVAQASDGQQAVDAVAGADFDFDLVFMDIQMPVLDGLGATRAIRKLPGSRGQVPIVVLTATSSNEELDPFLCESAAAVLVKPIRAEDFERALRQHSRSRGKEFSP